MNLRPLRIAVTVVSGLCCVLMIVLWVRSYETLDNIAGHLPFNPAVSCTSAYGRIACGTQINPAPWKWSYHNAVLDEQSYGGRPKEPRSWFLFQQQKFQQTVISTSVQVPHGIVALAIAALGIAVWLPYRRFSLRTLLLATTAVAILLGLLIYATRG